MVKKIDGYSVAAVQSDMLVITQNGLDEEIPAFCSFAYDFIKFQVKVIFEE